MLAIVACCAVLGGAELELYEEVDVNRDATAPAAAPIERRSLLMDVLLTGPNGSQYFAQIPAESMEAKLHAATAALAQRECARARCAEAAKAVVKANEAHRAAEEELVASAKRYADAHAALREALR